MIHVVEGKRSSIVNSVPAPQAASITMSLQAAGKACRIAAIRERGPLSASLALLIVCKRNKAANFQVDKASAFKTGAEKAAVEASDVRRLPPGAEQPGSGSSMPGKGKEEIVAFLRYRSW